MSEIESPTVVNGGAERRAPDGRMLELPRALAAHRWKSEQSGNPSGKGGLYHEAQRIAREYSPLAMQKLADLMNCGDFRVETVAANSLLERAWGKPREFDPKTESSLRAFPHSILAP